MLVDCVLRAGRIRMRYPDRRQAEVVREDIVRQRAADVREQRDDLTRRARHRFDDPTYPRMIGVETRRLKISLLRTADFDVVEGARVEMTPQRRQEPVRIGADDEAHLTMSARRGRNRVARFFRVPRTEGQNS